MKTEVPFVSAFEKSKILTLNKILGGNRCPYSWEFHAEREATQDHWQILEDLQQTAGTTTEVSSEISQLKLSYHMQGARC